MQPTLGMLQEALKSKGHKHFRKPFDKSDFRFQTGNQQGFDMG